MNNHILGIDHVMVTVGDLDVARNFYEGILGLEEMDCPVKDGQRVWYKIGGQQLHVNLQEKYHKAGFGHFAIAIESDKYHEYANMLSSSGYKLSAESQKYIDGCLPGILRRPLFEHSRNPSGVQKCLTRRSSGTRQKRRAPQLYVSAQEHSWTKTHRTYLESSLWLVS